MGEWKDGKKHGQGTFTYGKGKWEGDKYEGEFKVGYRNVKEHTPGLMETSM